MSPTAFRRILDIRCQLYVNDVDIFEGTQFSIVEYLVLQRCLQLSSHNVRMKDNRLPKQFLYDELVEGGKQRKLNVKRNTLKNPKPVENLL